MSLYVVIHAPHSGSTEVGAVTPGGLTEHAMGHVACAAMAQELSLDPGTQATIITGPVISSWKHINDALRQGAKRGMHTLAVAPHFNSSTNPTTTGHTAVIPANCALSVLAAVEVFSQIESALPWSRRKPIISVPDKRYKEKEWPNNLIFPRLVTTPSILIEPGFIQDKRFCDWIEADSGAAYGVLVARAIINWRRNLEYKHD